VASKQIYASHYFQAGLDLTALVDAPRPRRFPVDLYRARIPPTGMLGRVARENPGRDRAGGGGGITDGEAADGGALEQAWLSVPGRIGLDESIAQRKFDRPD
jgi:hypothetical protein